MKVSVLGGAGYIGGELLRILLSHPKVKLVQATSDTLSGKPIHTAHPNLHGRTDLMFTTHGDIDQCDVLFIAMRHGFAMHNITKYIGLAKVLIDLSADHRIKETGVFEKYYGEAKLDPEILSSFVGGTPEIYREILRSANKISVPGCMATPSILALFPFAKEGLLEGSVRVDARTGSSGSGAQSSPASHHPNRSGAMRVFKPSGHRHEAEISQICNREVIMSATGVEAIRGVQVVIHAQLNSRLTAKDVRALFRDYYALEPFVRIITRSSGLHRLPDPKFICGTNYCDLGFDVPPESKNIVLIGAVDNLVKGGAGAAVQSMNVRFGWDEKLGLDFPGLHPA